MNISFVGTEEEIKFIQKRNTNLSKILWVPLSLDALVYLDLKNEEYINTLNYFTNSDHKKGIDFQKKYFDKSSYKKQIFCHYGDAKKIIPELDLNFDLVFIDADKPNYSYYFDLILPKLNSGGIIIADNVSNLILPS